MKVYKLTDQKFFTRNNTLWGENVTHETSGEDNLCSEGWLHYYHNPYLAVLLNPIHANISNPILWEAKAEGKQLNDCDRKGGCTKLTTIKQLPLPEVTLEQRVEFAIRCAMEIYKNENWLNWAEKWLSGEDRSKESAHDASVLINTHAAAYTANSDAAAYATHIAAYTAAYTAVDFATENSEDTTYIARIVASVVADAVDAAYAVNKPLNLNATLQQVFG